MPPSSLSSASRIPEGTTLAVAIDKDKNSQYAVRWAVENIPKRHANLILVHVRTQSVQPSDDVAKEGREPTQNEMQQFFLPYRGFCARKGIRATEVVLNDIDISSALVNFIHNRYVSTLVLGASNRNVLTRTFKNTDVPSSLCRTVPDFCSIYVVSKGKSQNIRQATQSLAPSTAAGTDSLSEARFSVDSRRAEDLCRNDSWRSGVIDRMSVDRSSDYMQSTPRDRFFICSPGRSSNVTVSSPQHPASNLHLRLYAKGSPSNQRTTDINDLMGPPSFQSTDMFSDFTDHQRTSDVSRNSVSSHSSRDVETEMRRLKRELKQTVEMYTSACKEAISAKEKVNEIDQWKTEEARRLHEVLQAKEAALAMVEMEKQKARAAIEAAQTAQRIAELEAQKRKVAEEKAMYELETKKKALDALARSEVRYRYYTIEEIETATDYFSDTYKIGEGGYGPVYKARLDHTAVAIKVLKPEMSQGKKQFEREVEVLSFMRHPNMVLLLGACPEYGCLVYEYMENGSLEDRLFQRNNTPPLSWRIRFGIAAEIATTLLFLHQAKPEPLVHRDLKPANILLDRNYVSKIGDVGLARLVPASVADSVTQYQMTAAAGTFCYIDPEYQSTGMLCVKSDLYSLGVTLLQIITGKNPMSLTYHVGKAIEKGTLDEMLDPAVKDWPIEEATCFAKLALQCCELRRKDRPDLGSVVVPELQRLSDFALEGKLSDRGRFTSGASSNNQNFHVRPQNNQGKSRLGREAEGQLTPVTKENDGAAAPATPD